MNAKELRERSTEDLIELRKLTRREIFQNRMKNHTNQLDDTSLIPKARQDVARIETVLRERALKSASGSES
jgi:large subunit ribosomal protein L29